MSHSSHRAEGALAFALRRWRLQRRFRQRCGYAGDFEHPSNYEEKIQFRKLYGNHARYALVADKYRVREYVAERAGARYLIPLLGVYDRLTPEVFETLPERFVIKASHGCKWHRVVWNKADLDVAATVRYFNRLMGQRYGAKSGEYHYSLIEPKILIEELLADGGDSPADYCFDCYHGAQGFECTVAISTPKASAYYDRHWHLLEGGLPAELSARLVEPENYTEMVRVAEALSRGFDFIRVDLYNVAGRIYFGELTCTPHAGFTSFDTPVRFRMRTEMWRLDIDNEQLYRKPRTA